MKESDKSKLEISVDIQDQDAIFNEVHDYLIKNDMEPVAKRLEEIYYSTEEERDFDKPLKLKSLIAFKKFIMQKIIHKSPAVGLSPGGHLGFDWDIGDNKVISLWFFDEEKIKYFIDNEHLVKGCSNVDNVIKIINNI